MRFSYPYTVAGGAASAIGFAVFDNSASSGPSFTTTMTTLHFPVFVEGDSAEFTWDDTEKAVTVTTGGIYEFSPVGLCANTGGGSETQAKGLWQADIGSGFLTLDSTADHFSSAGTTWGMQAYKVPLTIELPAGGKVRVQLARIDGSNSLWQQQNQGRLTCKRLA